MDNRAARPRVHPSTHRGCGGRSGSRTPTVIQIRQVTTPDRTIFPRFLVDHVWVPSISLASRLSVNLQRVCSVPRACPALWVATPHCLTNAWTWGSAFSSPPHRRLRPENSDVVPKLLSCLVLVPQIHAFFPIPLRTSVTLAHLRAIG